MNGDSLATHASSETPDQGKDGHSASHLHCTSQEGVGLVDQDWAHPLDTVLRPPQLCLSLFLFIR